MKLKIVAPNRVGHQAKVYIDDKEITEVYGVSVETNVESVNTATLFLMPSQIDIEGDFNIVAATKIIKCKQDEKSKEVQNEE